MTPMLLIELAVKSTVVSGAALLLLALLGRRSPAERSWVAHSALVVLAALPAAVILLPRWRLLPAVGEPALPVLAPAPAEAASDPTLWLQTGYGAGVALLIVATAIAILRLVALRRGAAVLVDPDWLTALARAQARMKVKSGAALLVSTALTSPVSWGLFRPTIVVNDGLVDSKSDAEAVIAHELAHVVRLDWAKLIGARLVTALFWFNPLVWVLASQGHQLREEAADDAVLAAEVSSADYASLLVEAARHHGRGGLIAAHSVAPSRGSLYRRVSRVLDAAARRTPTPAAWAIGVVAGAALFAGPLAALTLQSAESPLPADAAMTVTSAAAPAERLLTTAGPTPAAKAASRAAVTVVGAPRSKVATIKAAAPARLTVAGPGDQAIATTGSVRLGKGRLTLAAAPVAPSLVLNKPTAPRVTVTAAAPAAPKVAAIVASPPAPLVVVKDGAPPRPRVTVTGMASASGSSSSSHSTTTNGKTIRVETVRDSGDRADQRADERDRRDAQADRVADQADRRADGASRSKDQAEARRNAERARRQDAAAQARAVRDEKRARAHQAADSARAAAAVERDAAIAEAQRRKTVAEP